MNYPQLTYRHFTISQIVDTEEKDYDPRNYFTLEKAEPAWPGWSSGNSGERAKNYGHV